jgi:hypothetical protein
MCSSTQDCNREGSRGWNNVLDTETTAQGIKSLGIKESFSPTKMKEVTLTIQTIQSEENAKTTQTYFPG